MRATSSWSVTSQQFFAIADNFKRWTLRTNLYTHFSGLFQSDCFRTRKVKYSMINKTNSNSIFARAGCFCSKKGLITLPYSLSVLTLIWRWKMGWLPHDSSLSWFDLKICFKVHYKTRSQFHKAVKQKILLDKSLCKQTVSGAPVTRMKT